MDRKEMFILSAFVVALVLVGIFFLTDRATDYTARVIQENAQMDEFVACLNEKNVRVFGVRDSVGMKMQAKEFQGEFNKISLVDCAETPGLCYGVILYPTWQINDIIIHGSLSIDALSKFSGCEI